jgi:hypothetical protein
MPHRLHVHDTPEGAKTLAKLRPPMGPGVDEPDILEEVVRLETWGSSFKDPGEDYCEFRFFNKAGRLFHTVRIDGY